MNKTINFIIGLILFLSLIIVGLFFYIEYKISQPIKLSVQTDFIIKPGETSNEIAENLEKKQIIDNKFYFIFYLWQKNLTDKLQAGKYELKTVLNIVQLANIFIGGEIKQNWVQVTIPEGFSIQKIDDRLSAAGLIKSGELVSRSSNFQFSIFNFQTKNLEGYLFPDTYRFDKDLGADGIIKKMTDNFEEKITPAMREEIQRQGKTLKQIIIMASILEKEVKSDNDRKIAAGIFWKRLELGWPLESCATIAYILGVDKWRYAVADTKVASPYNTYLNKGLPPTPINNPGLSTIIAAIYPEKSDYFFFLTDPDTGNTIFSKTLEEHNRNKAKYF